MCAVSYASVLRTEVGPEIPSPYPEEFIETEVIAPSQPWKPSIVVVPLESQFHSDMAPQSPQGHLEQEQYWRSIQSEHRKSISRLITAKSKDGFRSIPAMCHEASRASAEASKHALLARNPGLVVGIEHNTLHFYGFNDRHIKLTTSSPSSRTPFEFSIDFHGVDVLSSVQFINSVLSYLKSSNVLANRKCVIHLVVGRGSHSKGGVSRLKPALKSFLLRKGYRISVLEGEITVHTG